jgi:hypothetical protein
LHELRHGLGGRQQDRAARHHHDKAGSELRRSDHTEIDHWVAARKLPRDHRQAGEAADKGDADDEIRAEPILFKTAVEHHFEGAKKGCD